MELGLTMFATDLAMGPLELAVGSRDEVLSMLDGYAEFLGSGS